MFGALNFPENHPARDGYDTFRTEEGFIPPAHTSTMQNRILKNGKTALENGENIAVIMDSYGDEVFSKRGRRCNSRAHLLSM